MKTKVLQSGVVQAELEDGRSGHMRRDFGVNCTGALAAIEYMAEQGIRLTGVTVSPGVADEQPNWSVKYDIWRKWQG